MSIDVFWWFFKVEETNFSIVQLAFDQAMEGVPNLPELPALAPRPKAPSVPITQDYVNSLLEDRSGWEDLSSSLYHDPFSLLAHRILQEEFPLSLEDWIAVISQPRVAPSLILLMGIGSEKFSQLPGYLGNMLIHSSKVEQTIGSVSRILDVEWKSYFESAKLMLDYSGYSGTDARVVEKVSDALYALPRALEEVKNEGAGLLAVTSWGCP
jgi:hypothetical protein